MTGYRYQFAQILEKRDYDPGDRDLIEKVASALYERYEELPEFSRLPDAVRYFFACYDLNFQVGNGGFAQAAYNVPELFPIAMDVFRHFGCPQAAKICEQAIDLLPAELAEQIRKGLDVTESIEEVFEHFNDSEMNQLDDNIPDEFWADQKLHQLVENHRDDFLQMDQLQN